LLLLLGYWLKACPEIYQFGIFKLLKVRSFLLNYCRSIIFHKTAATNENTLKQSVFLEYIDRTKYLWNECQDNQTDRQAVSSVCFLSGKGNSDHVVSILIHEHCHPTNSSAAAPAFVTDAVIAFIDDYMNYELSFANI